MGEVAAADEPLVILLDEQCAGEPDQGGVVGVDADDVGAPADLAVDALERVGASQLGPVLARERVEGEQVVLGVQSSWATFGATGSSRSTTSASRSRASWPELACEDLAHRGGDHRLLALGAVAQHVAQEVHRAALPRAAEHLADRGPEALVAVGDAQPDAVRPRARSERRNSRQNASVSVSPTSRPITSRRPLSCTA